MDNNWINIRFGVRHLQIGSDKFSFNVNPYHVQNKPEKWFKVYKFFKLFP